MRVHLQLVSDEAAKDINNVHLGEGTLLGDMVMGQVPAVGEEVIGCDSCSYKVLRRVWDADDVFLLVTPWGSGREG